MKSNIRKAKPLNTSNLNVKKIDEMNYFRDVPQEDYADLEAFYRKTRTDCDAILKTYKSFLLHWHEEGYKEVLRFLSLYEDYNVIHTIASNQKFLSRWVIDFSEVSYPNTSVWGGDKIVGTSTDRSLSMDTQIRLKTEFDNQLEKVKKDYDSKLTALQPDLDMLEKLREIEPNIEELPTIFAEKDEEINILKKQLSSSTPSEQSPIQKIIDGIKQLFNTQKQNG